MTRPSHADDPEARRLRDAVAAELVALRRGFTWRKVRPAIPAGDIPESIGQILRTNPRWAAAAAAGALAGVVAAVRRRRRPNGD